MAAPLPTAFSGTPQQWFEQMLQRMQLENMPVGFVTSTTMPTSNQGPWLKNGVEIWVWNDDSATYVPQSLSWLNQQTYIGDINSTAPDPTVYQIWLQTNGSLFVGFAVYMGSYVGWVTPGAATGVANDSITTDMLQDGCVTSTKIAAGAITTAQLVNGIPVIKLAGGTAGQMLRTASDGVTVTWQTFIQTGPTHTFTNSGVDSFQDAHGLSAPPKFIRLVMVCTTADGSYAVGAEVDIKSVFAEDGSGNANFVQCNVYADASYIYVDCYNAAGGVFTRGGRALHSGKWSYKLYWGS
jgi:hypothetical protein